MSSYLILGQQGVANTCEQHHGYEKWDEASRRHVEEMADYRRPNFSGCLCYSKSECGRWGMRRLRRSARTDKNKELISSNLIEGGVEVRSHSTDGCKCRVETLDLTKCMHYLH
jgi:hypothetical protein